MATRRPLVLISGSMQELPTSDVLPGQSFPFYLASGAASDIELNDSGTTLPFFLASGAASDIPLNL